MGLIFCIGTSSRAISSYVLRMVRRCCWTLARARQAIGAKSRSVTSIVTPGYAPIEQYSSRGRQGAWTDIYALGGVCYRALTGEVPDDATDRMRQDPLIPVAQHCAGQASRGFLSAIDVALSVDEGDRPQSVGAWRVALEADAAETQKDEAGDATIVKLVEQDAPLSEPQKKPLFKRLAVVLGVVALLVIGGKMYVDHAEQVALEKQRQEQAVEKARLAAEQAEQQRQEQATLEQQRREQAALEQQRREQAALEQQRREQAALEQQRREQAALEQQRREQAALEQQRQEQVFVAEVGRMPHPRGMNKGETDLHIVARLNLPVLTISLLNQGADVHAKDDDGATPLHAAALKNASVAAEVLLNQGADQGADVHAKNNNGATPLHLAARENASVAAEVLLNQGADVHAKNNNGATPLHYAASENASVAAEVLLNQGADANANANDDGLTPLHYAAGKTLLRRLRYCSIRGPTLTPKTNPNIALRRCTMRRWRMLIGQRRCCLRGEPMSTPKITMALRLCTRRWGMMLLQRLKCCSGRGLKSVPKTTMARHLCTMRRGMMLLGRRRCCSKGEPTPTPKTNPNIALRRCSWRRGMMLLRLWKCCSKGEPTLTPKTMKAIHRCT